MQEQPSDSSLVLGLSRRRFLLLGAGATVLLTTAYASLRQVGCYPEPGSTATPYRHLTPKTAAVFALLGDYLLPPGGALPGSGGDATSLARLDEVLHLVPDFKRRLLLALPQVFEHGSGLDRFGARSMSKLPPERLAGYLGEWEQSRAVVRLQLWAALKIIYSLAYFERPDVTTAMGMPILCGGEDRWP